MNTQAYERLEAAAFAAWPSLEPEEMMHGWRLRYAGGYTKRANSANSGLASCELDAGQIADIEQRYRGRGLSPIFRLSSVSSPGQVDAVLERRGYRRVDPSWMMVLPGLEAVPPQASLRCLEPETWLSAFLHVSGSTAAGQDMHLRMLRAIRGDAARAVEYLGEDPVCCGLGVVHDDLLGLFDLATLAAQRRQGWATRLCGKLLAWGCDAGAGSAYLQVTASNTHAIRLYEQMGFRRAYDYWYRVAHA